MSDQEDTTNTNEQEKTFTIIKVDAITAIEKPIQVLTGKKTKIVIHSPDFSVSE